MRQGVVICLVALATVTPFGEAQQHASFPIEPGLTWTYRGHLRWTGSDRRIHDASLTWTMRIVSAKTGPTARAAVVSGWVQDLAWYGPSKKTAFSVLVDRAGRLYHLAAPDSIGAARLMETSVRGDAPPEPDNLVLDSALVLGRVYGRDSVTRERADNMYGWYVASDRAVTAPAAWRSTTNRARRVTLEYKTQPDYQSIDYVPGVGITRFVYSHHGTVADADVRLVSVQR